MQNLVKILLPRQLFMLLVLSTGLLNHVMLIPGILLSAGRDGWLCVIIAFPIALFFLLVIFYIVKNSPNEGFFPMIKQRLGKAFFFIFSFPLILFLLCSSYATFRDFMIWLKAYFLADYSVFTITLILTVICFVITLAGIKHMAISSGILLPLVMLFGIFIAITNTSSKDPSYLFPVFAHGIIPVVKGVIYVLSGLLEIYIVVLLQPFSQEPIKFRHLLVLLTILTGLIFGPLSAAIMEFGAKESSFMRYPAFEQWRILSIGEYISHLDFLALYQWLSGALIRISLFIYLIGTFFSNKDKHYRLNPIFVGSIYLVLFGLMIINLETYTFSKILIEYFIPMSMLFFLIQILITALIVLVIKKRDERHGKKKEIQSDS
ncbi:GerAB/ArcD/ProY family transporter [Neobacillus drentensis]|uniref:GerAB/ArcD/ProY family transporter n=1 Tax=Neobacillus drentensis TaxID=220684 RepID=UPI002FFF9D01